jgi:hypothetical protein
MAPLGGGKLRRILTRLIGGMEQAASGKAA